MESFIAIVSIILLIIFIVMAVNIGRIKTEIIMIRRIFQAHGRANGYIQSKDQSNKKESTE